MFTLTVTRIPNKSFIAYTFINQFFAFTLHLSSFQCCLLLQTLLLILHLYLHVSCCSIRLVSLVSDTRLNTLMFKFFTTSGTQFYTWIIDIVTSTTAFSCFDTERKEHRVIPININNLWSYFTFLIVH